MLTVLEMAIRVLHFLLCKVLDALLLNLENVVQFGRGGTASSGIGNLNRLPVTNRPDAAKLLKCISQLEVTRILI